MKKHNKFMTLLLSLMILSGCNNNSTSSQPNNSEASNSSLDSPSSEVSVSESSSDSEEVKTPIIDTSKYEACKFYDVEDLYLIANEEYHLQLMNTSECEKITTPLTFVSDITDYIDIDNNGKITAKSLNGQDIVEGKIYAHNGTKLQEININVVNYEEYGSFFMSVDAGRLYNKKVMFFGDSITHSWLRCPSGNRPVSEAEINQWNAFPDGFGYTTHYLSLINNVCHFSRFTNAAWSGGTMAYLPKSRERFTYKSLPGSIEEHVDDVINSDYIFIFYGTNDLTDQVPIGKYSDNVEINGNTNSSFIGGMNYGINRIRELNPDANIVFMNLLTRTYSYNGNISLDDYNNAIEEVATSYCVKVLDVKSLFTEKEFYPTYSNDGLHPNEEGYKIIANYILKGKK